MAYEPPVIVSVSTIVEPTAMLRLFRRSQPWIGCVTPVSAAENARWSISELRPTRYSCVEVKNAPAISAPITTMATIATARANPSRRLGEDDMRGSMVE